ncbi:NAD(P)H-dependent flavin oxidoreductase [Tropicibacter naphthalenivorans]|uniref:Putative enoyl-[acyl-carrier-protein] reductase II n=1 Tax=Tropicibacter naphthalenivorans TaxID=441103 RepID=A0A0N7M0Q6_9RHOB|nr:nitronate monooxygenase family protein [Tropicibacter naphthalenivorans]CUH81129.1 putative enoyl-[acyl-carrier-protein] reductase II [Tropicibacter naphthalenivorans]SMC97283.1 nitronate monooxygenase [Tropicibacter naphthalenivorans]
MALPQIMQKMRLPLVGSPMFIVSHPDLVIAQCKAGIVGSFPALNAREKDGQSLDGWLTRITEELDRHNQANPDRPAAPYAVNHIVHRSNGMLDQHLETCVKHKVPVWITSLGAREDVNEAAHSCGGVVFHDVIHNTFAKKAISKGADGLIAVAAGAGGHAGAQSPLALIREIRSWFDGPLLLSGAISEGDSLLAALAMGADGGYAGSAFIATQEANAVDRYKQMVTECGAEDILYSNAFTGVHGNYLKPSIEAAGMDPNNLDASDPSKMSFSEDRDKSRPKKWADIWGAGQGIGAVHDVVPVEALVARLEAEFRTAKTRLDAQVAAVTWGG